MTKDEELKDAREWLNHEVPFDINGEWFWSEEERLVNYHRHRLETAWVGAKERLPINNGWFNVIADGKPLSLMYNLLIGWHDESDDGNPKYWNNDVTHWQPLPEPPEGVK